MKMFFVVGLKETWENKPNGLHLLQPPDAKIIFVAHVCAEEWYTQQTFFRLKRHWSFIISNMKHNNLA